MHVQAVVPLVTIARLAVWPRPLTSALLGMCMYWYFYVMSVFCLLQFAQIFADFLLTCRSYCPASASVATTCILGIYFNEICKKSHITWNYVKISNTNIPLFLWLWHRKLLPNWFGCSDTMSSGHVGLDDGSLECNVFGSVFCWYGVFKVFLHASIVIFFGYIVYRITIRHSLFPQYCLRLLLPSWQHIRDRKHLSNWVCACFRIGSSFRSVLIF